MTIFLSSIGPPAERRLLGYEDSNPLYDTCSQLFHAIKSLITGKKNYDISDEDKRRRRNAPTVTERIQNTLIFLPLYMQSLKKLQVEKRDISDRYMDGDSESTRSEVSLMPGFDIDMQWVPDSMKSKAISSIELTTKWPALIPV